MADQNSDACCCGPGYASPADAIKAPREKLLYIGTGLKVVMNRCPKIELFRPFWKPKLNQKI